MMLTVQLLLIALALLPLAAWAGLLGERARLWMTELNEEGKRRKLERQIHDADQATESEFIRARSVMNAAAGQKWRNLSEWRDE
jgi:hypothetical protein